MQKKGVNLKEEKIYPRHMVTEKDKMRDITSKRHPLRTFFSFFIQFKEYTETNYLLLYTNGSNLSHLHI